MFYIYVILAGILHKYQYGSYHRGLIKQKYNIKGYVQDHHIIPRQFRSRVSLDLDNSNNIIILPTSYGKLFLDTKRPVHENGHPKYNKYVETLLDKNYTELELINILRRDILHGNITKII